MLLDTFLSLISNMTLTAQGKHFFVIFWHFFCTFLALFWHFLALLFTFCYLCSWIHFWASYSIWHWLLKVKIFLSVFSTFLAFFVTFLALFWSPFLPFFPLMLFMLLDTFLSLKFNMTLTARGKNIFVGFLALFSQRIKILFPNTK